VKILDSELENSNETFLVQNNAIIQIYYYAQS